MKTWQSTIYQERGRRALALLANGLSLLTVNKIRQQWLCGETGRLSYYVSWPHRND